MGVSIGECFKDGFEFLFSPLGATFLFLYWVTSSIQQIGLESAIGMEVPLNLVLVEGTTQSLLLFLLGLIAVYTVVIGHVRALVHNRESFTLGDFKDAAPLLGRLVIGGLLVLLLSLIGTFFFIIPGIYIFLGGLLFFVPTIEERTTIKAGLTDSWRRVRGNRISLFGLVVGMVVLQIMLASFPSFILGLIIEIISVPPTIEHLFGLLVQGGIAAWMIVWITGLRSAYHQLDD